jgi:CheY-like chemotaxis protein
MKQPRILVVDDERFNLEIISEFLDQGGYALALEDDGAAAWHSLDEAPGSFDAVILDRMMPGLDGMELLRRIKSDPRLAQIPVIMQTAAAAPEQVREGLAAGACYYLTKPFEPEALATIVRTALGDAAERARLAQQLESQVRVMRLAVAGEFLVRTLGEARELAALMAQLCPQPGVAVLGLSELLINAVEHGNLGIDYAEKSQLKREDRWESEIERRLALPENARRFASLAFVVDPAEIAFTIRDCGQGFDWRGYLDLDPSRAYDPNGRGIALARHLSFSSLEYQGSGNTVCARVTRSRDAVQDQERLVWTTD